MIEEQGAGSSRGELPIRKQLEGSDALVGGAFQDGDEAFRLHQPQGTWSDTLFNHRVVKIPNQLSQSGLADRRKLLAHGVQTGVSPIVGGSCRLQHAGEYHYEELPAHMIASHKGAPRTMSKGP